MTLALIIALSLIVLSCVIHYRALRMVSSCYAGRPATVSQLLFTVLVSFIAHYLVISLYAIAYFFMTDYLSIGHLSGDFNGTLMEFLYYSAVSYTSLGLGDIWPHGHIRLITSIEAINGLFLIGWSVTFTYPLLNACSRHPTKKEA